MGTTDVQTERVVRAPIINPATGCRSRKFSFAGKLDRYERNGLSGKVIDYKSSADIGRTIRALTLSFQPEFYAIAQEQAGNPVTSIEYRIIARPTIRLCGKDANRDAYEERCLEWLLADPMRLRVHEAILSSAALREARICLWQSAKRILENRRANRWLMSPHACHAWERPCPFLPVCEHARIGANLLDVQGAWLNGAEYRQVNNPHPELGEWGEDFGLLTHSSISMLLLCERRYYFLYELGIRAHEENSGALWIGNAMHSGIEAYAKKGKDAGLTAIDEWATEHPVLGEDRADKQDQEIARARAMVRAAARRWSMEPVARDEHGTPIMETKHGAT